MSSISSADCLRLLSVLLLNSGIPFARFLYMKGAAPNACGVAPNVKHFSTSTDPRRPPSQEGSRIPFATVLQDSIGETELAIGFSQGAQLPQNLLS